jgi:RimJ/RimL family protein N-acetyltransferase
VATSPSFEFHGFVESDLPLLDVWLRTAHVARWFGSRDEWLAEVRANLRADWVTHARADLAGHPAGFVQAYRTDLAPHGPWRGQPPGTFGIDFLLGRPEDLGRGLGRALVGQWSAWCVRNLGARRLVADPDADNEPSLRALRSCGFRPDACSGLLVREA